MICFGCSAKISYSEINRKRKMAHISQCSRFIYLLHCNKCNKIFNYLSFQKHKELFKKTLIDIMGVSCEAANEKRCKSGQFYQLQLLQLPSYLPVS